MDCEVLVVGGGPAGATAARFLASKGIETVLIERNLFFNKPCGGGIPSAGLKELGLLEDILENIPVKSIRKIKIVPPFSSPIEVDFKGGEILVVNRLLFDSFLRNIAKKNGAKLLESELIDLKILTRRFNATVKKKEGDILNISAKYVVAADGINSRVCSLTGVKKPDYCWTLTFHLPSSLSKMDDTIEFWFDSSHASYFYSWVFPGVDYISVGTGAEQVNKLIPLMDNFLKKRFLASLDELREKFFPKLKVYRIPKWSNNTFYRGNIIFCGDACGLTMPVSFEGIYYSMKSGQFVAEALLEKNLKLYETLWKDRFLRQFRIMKKFQDLIFVNDKKMDEWLNIHREPAIQELAMAIWLRKERGRDLMPLYFKAFQSIISRIVPFRLK